MNNDTSPLLRLPNEIRVGIFKLALQCDYIQHRKSKPPFQAYGPRKGRSRIRRMSSLLALTQVNRQIRAETRLLVWQVNVFHVSFKTIAEFTDALPNSFRACVKTIGILNDRYFDECVPESVELKKFPNLDLINFIPHRGGVTDQGVMQEISDEIRNYMGSGSEDDDDEDFPVGRIAASVSV